MGITVCCQQVRWLRVAYKYGQGKGKRTCNNRHNLAPHHPITAAQPLLEVKQATGTLVLVQSHIKQPSDTFVYSKHE